LKENGSGTSVSQSSQWLPVSVTPGAIVAVAIAISYLPLLGALTDMPLAESASGASIDGGVRWCDPGATDPNEPVAKCAETESV
jgi:hypothetical protein